MENNMTTVLITGGLGFIGTQIAQEMIRDNIVDKAILLDHYGGFINPLRSDFQDYRKYRLEGIEDKVIIERGETRNSIIMTNLIDKYRPDYIIHTAALPLAKIDNLNAAEAREGSVDSTAQILEIINYFKLKDGYCPLRFTYFSSSMIYGDFQSEIATEDHQKRPKEVYGTMKLAGEVVTKGLADFYGIPYTIVRPSAVYGPTDMNRRVSQIFIEKALNKQKIKVHGKDEKLDFTYIKDIAHGAVLATTEDKGANEAFNITHGKAHTLLDYVKCLNHHFSDLEYDIVPRDEFRPKRGTLSIEKAEKLIGYSPKYSLQEGVDEYVEFIKNKRAK
jgi:nucleoside-diphosphate-sugar epimerase